MILIKAPLVKILVHLDVALSDGASDKEDSWPIQIAGTWILSFTSEED